MPLSRLTALSPLDGRYADKVGGLAPYFSEWALMRYRVAVEVEYLLALLAALNHPDADEPGVADALRDLYRNFGEADAEAIKGFERTTRHDVKAVEYWLKQRLGAASLLPGDLELVHLGLTSEDVNNLAYALMHADALEAVLLPRLEATLRELSLLARAYRDVPMLARTHGQPASPTTMGKEMGVFAVRLADELDTLAAMRLPGKLGGATGTLAALVVAYPIQDWVAFAERLVSELGLSPQVVSTQIVSYDGYAACYDVLRRINHILLDLCQDMWQYVSLGYFRQKVVAGEVGSSAMPHKVNPIDFENAEGNLGVANALLAHLGDKLTVSRLQRDLSGSTVLRNAGVALGHGLLAWRSLVHGLGRVELDAARIAEDLGAHPEVLAEAIQTVLRAQGGEVPYERLKELTRGKQVTLEQLRELAKELAPARIDVWQTLDPAHYVGLAPQLADRAARRADETLSHLAPRLAAIDPAEGGMLYRVERNPRA